jgi:D-sedoheptulose 7-phosphate isomerase
MFREHQGSNGYSNGAGPSSVEEYFRGLSALIPQLPYAGIDDIVSAVVQASAEGRTVFIFGNGGSAATASHVMCDLNKGAGGPGASQRLRVMALTDNIPLITAWANDSTYENIFSEQLKNFVQRRDLAFAISTSGDSLNVIRALETAREYGAITVGLTGHRGGTMKPLCDICAVVPSDNVQMIEDMHHAIVHSVFFMVREKMQSKAPKLLVAQAGRFRL